MNEQESITAVAHELNSSLAGILGIVRFYMTQKNPDDAEYKDLERIMETCERMSKNIKKIQDFSRPANKEGNDG